MAIRYDSKLNKEIQRSIRNYNAKIRRYARENANVIIPERLTRKDLLEDVNTRKELRRKLKQLTYLDKRSIQAQEGLNFDISKYEYRKLKEDIKLAKSRLTRGINLLENEKIKVAGRREEVTPAQMAREDYLKLLREREALSSNLNDLSLEELDTIMKTARRYVKDNTRTDNILKENYLDMLFSLGRAIGYPEDKIQAISDKLMEKLRVNLLKHLKLIVLLKK